MWMKKDKVKQHMNKLTGVNENETIIYTKVEYGNAFSDMENPSKMFCVNNIY